MASLTLQYGIHHGSSELRTWLRNNGLPILESLGWPTVKRPRNQQEADTGTKQAQARRQMHEEIASRNAGVERLLRTVPTAATPS